MGRGLISGVLWGSVLSVMSVWLLSQVVDFVGLVSEPGQVVAVAPEAGNSNAGGGVKTPVAPGSQSSPATDPSRQGSGLDSGNSDAAPKADTASAQVPDASNVAAGQVSPQTGDAPDVTAAAQDPSATGAAATAPLTPSGEVAPKPVAPLAAQPAVPVASTPPANPAVPAEDPETTLAQNTGPTLGGEPDQPQSPTADAGLESDFSTPTVVPTPEPVEPEPVVVASAEAEPEPDAPAGPDVGGDTQSQTTGGAVTPLVPVVVDRSGGSSDSATLIEPNSKPLPEAGEGDEEADNLEIDNLETGPAIEIYAQSFDNPEGRPLMAIVLLPTADSDGLGSQATLPFPVSYVVDASRDDATDHMQRIRSGGNEVAMLAPLPSGATPKDVEIAFQSYMAAVPEAVVVMDVTDAIFQSGRAVATQVTDALAASGHGMVTYSRGLNSATQMAERSGVPSALVFRVFDDNARDGAAIKRFLDQAAFRAGQQSGVVLVGHDRPDTIAAMLEWALGNRASTVALAPLSAVLLAQ